MADLYTRERFAAIESRLEKIETKIDNFSEFKASMIVSTRFVSLVVSAVCGLVTLIATIVSERFFK